MRSSLALSKPDVSGKKKPQASPHRGHLWQRPDSSTKLTDKTYIAGGTGPPSAFLFPPADLHYSGRYKPVFLIAKALNARLDLLSRLCPLSCPCYIKMLDMVDPSFLLVF